MSTEILSPQKYLVLTCDTEALPGEAPQDHMARLIWGHFPNAPYAAGIGKMMDIADAYRMKITFFLDVIERWHYGAGIDRVAHYILDRGHDLQLHAHIEFLPEDFWTSRGYRHFRSAMDLYNETAARIVLGHATELFEGMAGQRPRAFRAGAFRYNAATLNALRELDIPISSQYYPVTAYRPNYPHGFDAGVLPPFRWSNGVIELPVGLYTPPPPGDPRLPYYGIEFHSMRNLRQARNWMASHWDRGPEFNVLVLVTHSWSLLERDEARVFNWKDDSRVRLFEELLAGLPSDVKVISVGDLVDEIQQGRQAITRELPLEKAGTKMSRLMVA